MARQSHWRLLPFLCQVFRLAIHYGEVMKKLVEANQRMVEANSWPVL
jgi:hypothetical protein